MFAIPNVSFWISALNGAALASKSYVHCHVIRFIDTQILCGIIPVRVNWLRSSTAEQWSLKPLVEGSNPPGVTSEKAHIGLFVLGG